MELKFKRLSPEATVPKRTHSTDAGLDLTAVSKSYDVTTGTYTYGTGLAVEIPEGYMGLLAPRSSIYRVDLQLANSVGIIDSAYRGEIMLKFKALGTNHYEVGERVGQLIIVPIALAEPEEVEELSNTTRNQGGFGSSGV